MIHRILLQIDFWLVNALFLWAIAMAVQARRALAAALAPERRQTVLWIAALFVAGLLLRLFAVPHTTYTFDDTFFHLDIAARMRDTLRFSVRFDDFAFGVGAEVLPKWMPVYHTLLSFVFRFAEPGAAAAETCNAIVGALAVPAAFLLGRALFRRDLSGLLLAALVCAYPAHLKFSGATGLEPISALLTILALAFAAVHWRSGDLPTALLAIAVSALCAMTRIDHSVTVALVCGLVILKALREPLGARRRLRILAALAALAFVGALLLLSYQNYAYWRAHPISPTPLSALLFLFTNPLNTLALPALAILGVAAMWRRDRILAVALPGAWVLTLIGYTFVHRLDVNHADIQRLHLNTCAFQIALATAALDFLLESPGRLRIAALVAVLSAYGAGAFGSRGAIARQYWPAERLDEVAWLEATARRLGPNPVVLTQTPVFVRAVAGLSVAMVSAEALSRSYGERPVFYYRAPYWKRGTGPGAPDALAASVESRFSLAPFATNRTAGGDEYGFFRMLPNPDP